MRQRIELNTLSDVRKFVNIASRVPERVMLEDNEGNRVSSKSLLGVMYSMEWSEVYCCCEKDIAGLILEWIV